LTLTWLDPKDSTWNAEVASLRLSLGAPANPMLFPLHFLQVTLPRIGGHIVLAQRVGRLGAAGFLFPGAWQAGERTYTLRWHRLDEADEADWPEVAAMLEPLVGSARVVLHDPSAPQLYHATSGMPSPAGLSIGHPDEQEAWSIRQLQQAIWQSDPDDLYPIDIHGTSFGAAHSLVARSDGAMAGFLFGFYAFAGPVVPQAWRVRTGFRLESQLLGVVPERRGQGIAAALKAAQAHCTRELGIDLVHWTFDPLQFANALLNLGRLRAVAYTFYPRLYRFRNVLNRVDASRLAVTWLVHSGRVQAALADNAPAEVLDLSVDRSIVPVNYGYDNPRFDVDAATIALEIPAQWTALQAAALDEARAWRHTTDSLLSRYLGHTQGRYMVTGVGQDGPRCYLIAERIDQDLLQRMGDPEMP
jgi:predicted GNAT superfamily acetyltransferase